MAFNYVENLTVLVLERILLISNVVGKVVSKMHDICAREYSGSVTEDV
jgi:hypothetical protein